MRHLFFRAILFFALNAHAGQDVYIVGGKPTDKIGAVKALLANQPVQKVRACDAALSKNLGIRCKKHPKKSASIADSEDPKSE